MTRLIGVLTVSVGLFLSDGHPQSLTEDFTTISSSWNSPIPSAWQAQGGSALQGQYAPNTRYILSYTPGLNWTDYTVDFTFTAPGWGYEPASLNLYVRYKDVNNGYTVQISKFNGTRIGIFKNVNGASSTLAEVNFTLASPETLRVSVVGSSIGVYRGSILLVSATDSQFTSGTVGFEGVHSPIAMDRVVVASAGSTATDGYRIVAVKGEEKTVWTMKLDGSQLTKVPITESAWMSLANGQLIFSSASQGGQGIGVYVMNIDGSGLRKVAGSSSTIVYPGYKIAIAPDGARVAYAGSDAGDPYSGFNLWVAKLDGSSVNKIMRNTSKHTLDPAWGPGEKIYFAHMPVGNAYAQYPVSISSDGSNYVAYSQVFTQYMNYNSRTGRIIASRSFSGAEHLVTLNSDCSDEQSIPGATRFVWPDWDPVDNAVYAVGMDDGNIYRVDVATGAKTKLTTTGGFSFLDIGTTAASGTAPAITTQPVSAAVSQGANTTFSVIASGTPAPTYQWRKDGTAISGATSATLALANLQSADAGSYSVVVTNSAGSVTSSPANLAVTATAPLITTQPQSQTVNQGQSATLTVTATGAAPISYQWRKDGTDLGGATSATLSISNVQSTNAGSYSVIVRNSVGSVTSSTVPLAVNIQPAISTQPQGLSVAPGSSASFSVTASGTAPLSYQWFKDGTPIGGATGTTLTLSAVQTTNAGNYTVVITNSAGSVTSGVAALAVNAGVPPTITAQPADQSVTAGATATFTVGVSGTSPFTYQWRFNGAAISGATNNPLVLANVVPTNAGSYTVLVTNATGTANSATSAAAILTVTQPPVITTAPADQSAPLGGSVVFSVVASGASPLSYQWSKDGRAITAANNAILSLTNLTYNDAGSYSVAVSNGAGTTTSRTVTLIVSQPESKIVNVSVRTTAGAGSESLIVGFVISGQGAGKPILVRGIGPSLAQFDVTGVLVDPQLTLYRDTVSLLSNDDWGSGTAAAVDQLAALFGSTGAFQLNRNSKDAALRTALNAGAYSANVTSTAGTGIALVELYDADFAAAPRFSNVSARSQVGVGAGILIVGFAIRGNAPMKVMVRGVGPALAAFGVSGVLANPQLVLLKDNNDVVDSNDDWWRNGGAQALAPVFTATGAFPLTNGTADAALLAVLQPGSYTAQVKGAENTTGVALVEVYEVP